MQIRIYADVVFLINFFMDFLIFFIVSKLVRKKIKIFRLILGALVASLTYCILIFTPVVRNYYNFFSSLMVLSLGILVTFGVKNIRYFIKLVILSHISAFAIGGLSIALFYYTNITDILGDMLGFTIEYFSFKLLLASSCIIYLITKFAIRFINSIILKKQCLCDISVFLKNKEISLKALVDTGNSLCDPITKAPVIIAEYECLEKILPENFGRVIYESKENFLTNFLLFSENFDTEKNFRLIPFKALGTENGMLVGFKPDKIYIYQENNKFTEVDDVIVCICDLKLSSKQEYKGLLNPAILDN